MMDQGTYTLTFQREQLCLLASLMQLHGLMGFEDPFLGLLADELQESMTEALHGLEVQGLVKREDDGTVAIDAALGACVQAAGGAERTIMLSHHAAGREPVVSLVHVDAKMIVEQRNAPDGHVVITALRDGSVLVPRLHDLVSLPEAPVAPGDALVVAKPDLDTGQRIAAEQGAEASAAFWVAKGVTPEVAEALAVATHHGSLAVLRRSATQADYGATLAWLVGPRGAWRMQPVEASDPPAARLVPASSADIVREIRRIIWEQLPTEA